MKWLDTNSYSDSHPHLWSAVIPAAGLGSRLKFSGPKVLYPIEGRPILFWLLDSLRGQVDEVILVINPLAQSQIVAQLQHYPFQIKYVIQPTPVGMADAVNRGMEAVTKSFTWVIWGDQPFVRNSKIKQLSAVLESESLSGIIPLIQKSDPYVHYDLDSQSRLRQVRQRRENEDMPEKGYSDLGCFAFRTQELKDLLQSSKRPKGGMTQEWNFLPELPRLEEKGSGLAFSIFDDHSPETISINTPEDAHKAENWLKNHPFWNEANA